GVQRRVGKAPAFGGVRHEGRFRVAGVHGTAPARIARLPPLFTPSRVKAPARSRLCLTWVNRRADPWSADGSRRRTRAEHGSALYQTKAEHGSALQEGLERLPD